MINKIKSQFDHVLEHSQGIVNPKTEKLFETWESHKKHIVDRLGGLIYEIPEEFVFAINEDGKKEILSNFINDVEFLTRRNVALLDFLIAQKDAIWDNKIITRYGDAVSGMKISRALKFFIEDKDTLNSVQSKLSELLQKTTFKGKVTLSVHPLDFLSISENAHNWRSCHALDGDYRSGNLNYMADKNTIICYISSKEDRVLPNFPADVPWNSKKWRVLLHVSEAMDLMFLSKQYPYALNGIESYIKEKVGNTLNPEAQWTDFGKYSDHEIDSAQRTCHFNDCTESTCYTPVHSYDERGVAKGLILTGLPAMCLECGQDIIHYEDQMRCFDCGYKYSDEYENEDLVECSSCGSMVYYEDTHESWGGYFCPDCVGPAGPMCACDHCYGIKPIGEIKYIEDSDEYLCSGCLESKEEKKRLQTEYQKSVL